MFVVLLYSLIVNLHLFGVRELLRVIIVAIRVVQLHQHVAHRETVRDIYQRVLHQIEVLYELTQLGSELPVLYLERRLLWLVCVLLFLFLAFVEEVLETRNLVVEGQVHVGAA